MDELWKVVCVICGTIQYINGITPVGRDSITNEVLYPIHCSCCDCSGYATMATEEIKV
jgi:hypothetical protein